MSRYVNEAVRRVDICFELVQSLCLANPFLLHIQSIGLACQQYKVHLMEISSWISWHKGEGFAEDR